MIGILILTHETLGQAYTKIFEHFFGNEKEKLKIIGVLDCDTPETIHSKIQEAIKELDVTKGVLILTDIFGATPCNVAKKFINNDDITLITGLNAPMLIKAVQGSRQMTPMEQLAEEVKKAAHEGVIEINIDNLKQYS